MSCCAHSFLYGQVDKLPAEQRELLHDLGFLLPPLDCAVHRGLGAWVLGWGWLLLGLVTLSGCVKRVVRQSSCNARIRPVKWCLHCRNCCFQSIGDCVCRVSLCQVRVWPLDCVRGAAAAEWAERRMPPMPLNGMPGHRQCCATCGTGVHSRRCDRAFRRFERLIVSVCRTAGCNLQVQEGHTTCCSTCWLSGGRQHTRRCSRRQGLLTARLHAWAPAGADGAGADGTAAAPNIAAHRGSVEGGSNRDALARARPWGEQMLPTWVISQEPG